MPKKRVDFVDFTLPFDSSRSAFRSLISLHFQSGDRIPFIRDIKREKNSLQIAYIDRTEGIWVKSLSASSDPADGNLLFFEVIYNAISEYVAEGAEITTQMFSWDHYQSKYGKRYSGDTAFESKYAGVTKELIARAKIKKKKIKPNAA